MDELIRHHCRKMMLQTFIIIDYSYRRRHRYYSLFLLFQLT